MKHIVVQPHPKGFSIVKIIDADVKLDKPFDSWALNTGKRLLFAHNQMHRLLKSHYMVGSFEQGAMYAYDFAEMSHIITSTIGLDDKAAYEALLAQGVPQKSSVDKSYVTWYTVGKACEFLIWFTWGIVKVVSFLLVIPFLISWINKRK